MKSFLLVLIIPFFVMSQTSVQKGKTFLESKQFSKAEKELKSFVDNNSNNLEAIELLGDAYGHQKKWDEAAKEYKKLVEAKPNNANYHYKLGGALGMKALSVSKISALGIIGDVKSSFLKAAELDPNHIEARWALVELYMQLPGIIGGSKKTSLKYANQLENLSKVDGYLAKGYIYEYDNEPELAEEYYLKAIKVGGSLTCYEKLTELYKKEDQPDKAVANMEAAQIKHQRNSLHYQIGKVCADYNVQLDKGEQCLKVYIQNHSAKDGVPKAWANYRLAQIYKHRNDNTNALKYINLAISELPDIEVFKDFKETL
ncbi:tetratricopeptide repeat protein [Olleya aquimaris]|uniref:Tetratricopeptide repeat protein n=1 Tax=Olleya aquimaris TaxID=639310 RepID=A0A327RL59_9FLAO|nr:tetratricopeptide repeat protein [Olleya aquimaris]RAJ14467.1 tetratricopeptide repeat protein [Olleya aquimaris]